MKKIIYQFLPRLWGRGKMSDLDEVFLTYVKSLSVDYIWYTSIPRHAQGKDFVKGEPGSPYAISDWKDVNPYLADKPEERIAEFSALIKRTHKAGMKVLTDFIPNHVAKDYQGDIVHFDYCDADWSDTLKVNWEDPRTFEAMVDVLRFWAGMGVDGFRCDMVELVSAEKLSALIRTIKTDFPDLLFVAEIYNKANYRRYLEAGFDLLYDKCGLYDSLVSICTQGQTAELITWNWQFLGDMQPRMLNFLENHDELRLASRNLLGSAEKSYAALAVSLLFNTASFMLYAGQEVGERAEESPDGRTSIFNWCRPGRLHELYSNIRQLEQATEKFREQLLKKLPTEEKAVLSRYLEFLSYAAMPVFRSGKNWDLCYCNLSSPDFDPHKHFAFVRYDAESGYLVASNFSGTPAFFELNIPSELNSQLHSRVSSPIKVEISPMDALVLKI